VYSLPMQELADLVRDARKRRGLTQEQLAEAIDRSYSWVGMLETGKVDRLKPRVLRRISEVLQVPREDFLRATGELDEPAEEDLATLLLRLDALPTPEERRAAFRELPVPVRRAIRRLMRDLFDEASEQLQE
jgi:transcriptional regulator with XRE-family HTH domain